MSDRMLEFMSIEKKVRKCQIECLNLCPIEKKVRKCQIECLNLCP